MGFIVPFMVFLAYVFLGTVVLKLCMALDDSESLEEFVGQDDDGPGYWAAVVIVAIWPLLCLAALCFFPIVGLLKLVRWFANLNVASIKAKRAERGSRKIERALSRDE